ncbi:MAG: tetratricopeptide repeat protein, partial [Verrucomicrobiota bacterium]|nr:tetratricopeptide repeat protein [Verrucomicrobiota bacterium]
MKEHLTTLLLFLISTDTTFGKDQNTSLFKAGNVAFHDGRFGQSLTNYQAQINTGVVSAPLHFNLATAAFHDRQLGRAIFHYRQAHSLDPRDTNIHHNLKIARDEVHNGSPPKPGLWQRLTGFSTLNEWTLVATTPLTAWFIWLATINIRP